jgi:iron complex transport system permease protein
MIKTINPSIPLRLIPSAVPDSVAPAASARGHVERPKAVDARPRAAWTADRRARLIGAGGWLLLAVGMVAAIVVGPAGISLSETIRALLHPSALDPVSATTWQETVIWQVRLPRVVTGALVGASLAVSGAVLQGLFRNPLASPSILGVSSGASLGAVIAIFLGFATVEVWALPLSAFLGALVTLLLVYAIATRQGQTPIATLLLAGIAVGAFNVAMSSLVLALALEQWEVGKSIIYWTMGGLDGRTWDHVVLIAPVFAIGLPLMVAHRRELDALLVGEIHAAAIGVDVARTRLILLLITAFLVGAAVAVSGGIGFIGLVVPHIVRLMTGPHHRHLIPLSALGGAIALMAADILLRVLFVENNVPLGVLTAAMGAPFFLFLLMRQRGLGRF